MTRRANLSSALIGTGMFFLLWQIGAWLVHRPILPPPLEVLPIFANLMAGELGLRGVKAFVFHDGRDPNAKFAFRQIAKLTGGACLPFDRNSASELRALLVAVATYAAGGRKALEAMDGETAKRLLADMR